MNQLMLFRYIISIYCGNHTKHINIQCGKNVQIWR